MFDFTLNTFRNLLETLNSQGYTFQTFENYLKDPRNRTIILRHDVDNLPRNALRIARIENQFQIKGTFYFRIHKNSFNTEIIKEIAALGHEIGYHYEDINIALSNMKNSPDYNLVDENVLMDEAWKLFNEHLLKFRQIYPIATISMHGSPRSKYDNKALWQKYDFRKAGIIGEPYLDLNFNEVSYFTDTGRRWNGYDVSIRDKVTSRFNFNFRSTQQIIDNIDNLPNKVMFTFHPQRWTASPVMWLQELLMQNVKNIVKGALVRRRWGEDERE
jgi:hypothetical protein